MNTFAFDESTAGKHATTLFFLATASSGVLRTKPNVEKWSLEKHVDDHGAPSCSALKANLTVGRLKTDPIVRETDCVRVRKHN